MPALRALRAGLPGAEIVLIGLPWARAFVARFDGYLDGFREFPGFPGLPERPPEIGRIPAFLAEIQAERFDLAIQLHGSGPFVNPLVALLRGDAVRGVLPAGRLLPRPGAVPAPGPSRAWRSAGCSAWSSSWACPTGASTWNSRSARPTVRSLAAIDGAGDLAPGGYACVHPGASVAERRWPAERFAAAADALADRGLRVVLTGTGGRGRADPRGRPVDAAPVRSTWPGGPTSAARAPCSTGPGCWSATTPGVSHVAAALRRAQRRDLHRRQPRPLGPDRRAAATASSAATRASTPARSSPRPRTCSTRGPVADAAEGRPRRRSSPT